MLPLLIDNDQTGYLKNRFIGENVRLLQDISFFTEKTGTTAFFLSIDFEKAFDSLNWNFLFKVLKHVNFGGKLIGYIKMMYNNIESTVINNGNTGGYFKLERGVRQGCLLSAYLFILSIEILANKLRHEKNIKGIKIDNTIIKLSMLADDLTLILQDLKSIANALKLLKSFSLCSGLTINTEKTKVKNLGPPLSADHYPHGLSWIKTPLETLGIYITNNAEENLNHNFKPKIATLRNTLNIWKQRTLSMKGKITIINTLALSPLIYTSSLIDTPPEALKCINDIIQNFIWEGKTAKIAQNTLIKNIDQGGLKLCHYPTKVKALKLFWIKRLCNESDANWKSLP